MKLKEIEKVLNLRRETRGEIPDIDVIHGYTSDLLSDVMANAVAGSVWITLQTHPNVVGVAVLKDIPAIIITGGRKVDEETLKKAEEKGVCIFSTDKNSFEVSGILYEKGLR